MRYLPLTPDDRAEMLGVIGAATIDDLFKDVPAAARKKDLFDLPLHAGEQRWSANWGQLAALNRPAGAGPFFCGAGAYRHHVPASVDHIIQRSEFLTSYTPYQPEIAQGTLQVLFEFQTQVAALTGLEVANASMYDGSTACAEAVMMAQRVTRREKAILSGGVHPHYAAVTQTIAHAEGMEIVRQAAAIDAEAAVIDAIDAETACVVVQTPNVFGVVTDVTRIAEAAHAAGALLIVVTTEARLLRPAEIPRRDGRRHRRRRGPVDRQRPELRRPLRRPLHLPREARPPDARPPLRRDRRCGGCARLRPDALQPASSTSAARRRRPTSAPTPASARLPSPSTCRCWARPAFASSPRSTTAAPAS